MGERDKPSRKLHRFVRKLLPALVQQDREAPLIGIPGSGRSLTGERFANFLDEARKRNQSLRLFLKDDLDSFRRIRNRVIHYGFSPKDDEETVVLLLGVGFRFLDQCYKEFFDFTLEEGLLSEPYEQLTVAMEVYDKAKNVPGLDHSYCFRAFGHLIRWLMKDSFMVYWEFNSAQSADEYGEKFCSCEEHKSDLERAFGLAWDFDCPICSEVETFICELDDDQIENEVVSIKRAMCVNCQFVIPHRCPFLAEPTTIRNTGQDY
jgi:hypothetical protein